MLPGRAGRVRFHGDLAYRTEAGRPGIIVVNLAGVARCAGPGKPTRRRLLVVPLN